MAHFVSLKICISIEVFLTIQNVQVNCVYENHGEEIVSLHIIYSGFVSFKA